jgi:hypothetical protein
MAKSMIDQQALIDLFSNASAQQTEQLRKAVTQATLTALQSREMTLKNVRNVLQSVAKAAGAGVAQSGIGQTDATQLLDTAVAGMDQALLQAVEAHRVAMQRLIQQGADVQGKPLKKALDELERMEDGFLEAIEKAGQSASDQVAAQWGAVLERLQAGGSQSGQQASQIVEQMTSQLRGMQDAFRETRAAGVKATQALMDSYATLVSGVLMGMSDALDQRGGGTSAPAEPVPVTPMPVPPARKRPTAGG